MEEGREGEVGKEVGWDEGRDVGRREGGRKGQKDRGRGRIITFCVRRSRGEMYSGHGRLYVGVSVCPLLHSRTTAWTRM